jgi:hypothetical protein
MDQREDIIDFSSLINKVYFQKVLSFLSLQDLLKMRLTSTQIKEIVDTYIRRYRQTLLHLPPRMCTQLNLPNLPENIVKACAYFGKQPEECDMTLNCTIFYDKNKTRVTTTHPMKALLAVSNSGVKISLNIMFDFSNDDRSVNLWPSYISELQSIVEYLPNTESLHLDFSHEIMEEWGDEVINSLGHLTQLTSLSICNMHVTGTELITCLSKMTHLSSFSISEVKIDGLNSSTLGQALEIVLPRLSKLKLSNSYVESDPIIEVLPHIRRLLSNLTSLDLSNNKLDRDTLHYEIVPAISGYVSNLKTLNLSYTDIDGNCIDELIPTLQMLPSLSELVLSSNNLDYDAIKRVAKSLPMLKVLDVTDNNPSDEQRGMESLD